MDIIEIPPDRLRNLILNPEIRMSIERIVLSGQMLLKEIETYEETPNQPGMQIDQFRS